MTLFSDSVPVWFGVHLLPPPAQGWEDGRQQPGSQALRYGAIAVTFLPASLLLLFSHSVVSDSVTPGTAACQASLSTTNSQNLLKLMSIESAMPSNPLILCCPLPSCQEEKQQGTLAFYGSPCSEFLSSDTETDFWHVFYPTLGIWLVCNIGTNVLITECLIWFSEGV